MSETEQAVSQQEPTAKHSDGSPSSTSMAFDAQEMLADGQTSAVASDTEPTEEVTWVERWVIPYLGEPALWPILFALLGHVVALLVLLTLQVVRYKSIVSGAALWGLGLLSVHFVRYDLRRNKRPGAITWTVGLTWLSTIILSIVAYKLEIL